jgi:2-dehydro-3-deoxyglucarate aldolase/4-hydroxy-2-oxoheptanedioate aldolase
MQNIREQMIGTIYSSGNSSIAEIISQAGFDWVMIDMEHSAISLNEVQNSMPVFGNRMMKVVRVPGNDDIWIKRVLDTGCDGILVPMVNSREEAEKVVLSTKYPPSGRRSTGLSRAHGYGRTFDKYLKEANDNIHIMIQIEHVDGIRNIDSIVSVKGIDSVFIGPYDLSASMGLSGQVTHPEVLEAIDLIKNKCRDAGLPYGIYGGAPEVLMREMNDGCKFVLCGVDISIFSGALADMFLKLHNGLH